MDFVQAGADQIDTVEEVVGQCREDLEAQGILQWDAEYPNREFFLQSVAAGSLFVLLDEGDIKAVVVLDERQASEWKDVAWSEPNGPVLAVHSLAVLPASQGKGYGKAILGFCETFARENGYTIIRLDAFSENTIALRFYERHGYRMCGEITLPFKPAGHQCYYCYEKRLI